MRLDDLVGNRYNNDSPPGVRDSFSVFPTFRKMEPGSKERYATPPFYTPGDGRVVRQGTSLLYIAGEKTRASAPWGHQNHRLRRPVIFCLHCVQKAFMFIRYLYCAVFQLRAKKGGAGMSEPEKNLKAEKKAVTRSGRSSCWSLCWHWSVGLRFW